MATEGLRGPAAMAPHDASMLHACPPFCKRELDSLCVEMCVIIPHLLYACKGFPLGNQRYLGVHTCKYDSSTVTAVSCLLRV